jgi:hypothetical protein
LKCSLYGLRVQDVPSVDAQAARAELALHLLQRRRRNSAEVLQKAMKCRASPTGLPVASFILPDRTLQRQIGVEEVGRERDLGHRRLSLEGRDCCFCYGAQKQQFMSVSTVPAGQAVHSRQPVGLSESA